MPNVPTDEDDVLAGDTYDYLGDQLAGLGGNDRIHGLRGPDRLHGENYLPVFGGTSRGGSDWIDGGEGDDLVVGDFFQMFGQDEGGNDTLVGGLGDDNFSGDAEHDMWAAASAATT